MTLNELNNKFDIYREILKFDHIVNLSNSIELRNQIVNNINIIMTPRVMQYGSCRIAMLPWINPENHAESMNFIQTCDAPILGAHLELAGFDMQPGVAAIHGESPEAFKRFEAVLSGHYHTKSTKGNIHYLGTQFEMTWADVDDPNHFHVLIPKHEKSLL